MVDSMRKIAALIVCATALLGLGGTASGTPAAPPSPAGSRIVYKRSGGFTGGTESLVIRPGHNAVAIRTGTEVSYEKVSFPLSDERIRALKAGLHRAHFGSIEGQSSNTCADCYRYEICYRGHRVTLVAPEVRPRLAEVIDEFDTIISADTLPTDA